jgi:TonB family protein
MSPDAVNRNGCVSIVVCLLPFMVQAAPAGFTPARIAGGREDALTCETTAEGHDDVPGEIVASFTIRTDGGTEQLTLPVAARGLERLADCVLSRLKFTPETRKAKVSETRGSLRIDVALAGAGDTRRLRVSDLGALMTLPRFLTNPASALDRCIDNHMPGSGTVRFVIDVTIAADGSIAAMHPPAGAPQWVTRVAQCIRPNLHVSPGTRDGDAVESQVSVPIVLHASDSSGKLSYPQPPSDPQLIEDAYRACYPPDQAAMGSVTFSFSVRPDGSVTDAKIVHGSGDDILDKAAECILPRLRFVPMKRNGRAVEASITWALPVRPPR